MLRLTVKVEDFSCASPVIFLLGFWICCWDILWVRSFRGLCATGCFQLWQPQYIVGLSTIYDADFFERCLSEPNLKPLAFFKHISHIGSQRTYVLFPRMCYVKVVCFPRTSHNRTYCVSDAASPVLMFEELNEFCGIPQWFLSSIVSCLSCLFTEQAIPKLITWNSCCDQFSRCRVRPKGTRQSQVCSSSFSMAPWITPLCPRDYSCGSHVNMFRMHNYVPDRREVRLTLLWSHILKDYGRQQLKWICMWRSLSWCPGDSFRVCSSLPDVQRCFRILACMIILVHALGCIVVFYIVNVSIALWFLNYMMIFFSSTTTAWVVIFEFWGLPLFWLSLPLVRLSAQRQEPLWSRFCYIAKSWSFDVMVKFSYHIAFQVMLVVDQVLCIDNHPVTCLSGCCTPSANSCNFSIIRILEQHLYVLGLCLMALGMHPWMPSPAQYGCCLFSCCAFLHLHKSFLLAMQRVRCALQSQNKLCNFCPSNFVVSHHGMTGLCIMALAWHRRMLETVHDGLGQSRDCHYCDNFTCLALIMRSLAMRQSTWLRGQGCVVPNGSFLSY